MRERRKKNTHILKSINLGGNRSRQSFSATESHQSKNKILLGFGDTCRPPTSHSFMTRTDEQGHKDSKQPEQNVSFSPVSLFPLLPLPYFHPFSSNRHSFSLSLPSSFSLSLLFFLSHIDLNHYK